MNTGFLGPAVATVLTACGIETSWIPSNLSLSSLDIVATVLTACGIETLMIYNEKWFHISCNSTYRLRY